MACFIGSRTVDSFNDRLNLEELRAVELSAMAFDQPFDAAIGRYDPAGTHQGRELPQQVHRIGLDAFARRLTSV